MKYKLRISGKDHATLRDLLYPGDDNEAGAILTCGRLESANECILLTQTVHQIPESAYIKREPDYLEYDQSWMTDLINDADSKNRSIIRIHSHPGGFSQFSALDDRTDTEVIGDWYNWFDRGTPHGSAVMLPDGSIFGRIVAEDSSFIELKSISVAGDRYYNWTYNIPQNDNLNKEALLRNIQAFGEGTISSLQSLRVGVVGCSGTGSIAAEQLARLGIGELLLIDPDVVEEKNLNRIINSSQNDALSKRDKVKVIEEMINRMGLGTTVHAIPEDLLTSKNIKHIASCDVIFGCVDGAEARHIMNRISTYYVVPYFDVGVSIQSDGTGSIEEITGIVNYIQPKGSSLLGRGAYTLEQVEAETMHRLDPETYEQRRKENYIAGIDVDRPAVMPLNMHFSSMMILDFLARIHGYRFQENIAVQQHNLEDLDKSLHLEDEFPCPLLSPQTGRGDLIPLLGLQMFA